MGWDIHYLISSNTTARLAVTSYGICDASLLIFLITSCLTRKPMYKPEAIAFKSLFVSILCWIVSITVILEAWIRFAMDPAGSNSSLGEEETPSIAKIFATLCLTFFGNLWYILIPNVLYHLLQGYKSLQSENDTSALLIFMPRKWILCMLVVNYVSAIIFWLISVLDYDAVKSRDDMNTHSHRFQLATHVLLFVAALEIMIETCAIVSSRKDLPPLSRKSTTSLLCGTTFYFLFNLFGFVTAIEDYLFVPIEYENLGVPETFSTLRPLVTAICTIGFYVGIIHCCRQWHKMDKNELGNASTTREERSPMLAVAN